MQLIAMLESGDLGPPALLAVVGGPRAGTGQVFLPNIATFFGLRTKLANPENGGEACADFLLRILPLNDIDSCNPNSCLGKFIHS